MLDTAYRKAVDELLLLGLIEIENTVINFKDPNTRRLFQHHIIHEVCEALINCTQSGVKVIYYTVPISSRNAYLVETGDYDQVLLESLLMKITRDMQAHFPIIFYSGGVLDIQEFQKLLTNNDTGEAAHHLNMVLGVVNSFDATLYRYDKIRALTKRLKLNFLSKEYFNHFKSKKLAYQR